MPEVGAIAKPARPTAAEIDKLFETLDELRRLRVPDAPAVPRSKPGLTEARNRELLALRMKEPRPRAAKATTDVADQINAAFATLGRMGMAGYQRAFRKQGVLLRMWPCGLQGVWTEAPDPRWLKQRGPVIQVPVAT